MAGASMMGEGGNDDVWFFQCKSAHQIGGGHMESFWWVIFSAVLAREFDRHITLRALAASLAPVHVTRQDR